MPIGAASQTRFIHDESSAHSSFSVPRFRLTPHDVSDTIPLMANHAVTNPSFQRIGILHHPKKPEALPLAEQIAGVLQRQGCQPSLFSAWEEQEISAHVQELDLLVTLGGDGTMLRAGHLCAPHGLPILGINMGRFGFLMEVKEDQWREMLLDGRGHVVGVLAAIDRVEKPGLFARESPVHRRIRR